MDARKPIHPRKTMAIQSTPIVRESFLRAQEIRELIRDAHGAFAPDYVARILRDRYMEPAEGEAEEIATLLGDLADMARKRIEESGIEPLADEKELPLKLSKRERENVANLAMLLATYSMSLVFTGRWDDALAVGEEGLAWGRTSGDYLPQTLQSMALFLINERLRRPEQQRAALLRGVELARLSGSPLLVVEAMLPLISFTTETMALDEAERLNHEVQSLLREEVPEEQRHPHYAVSLGYAARIARYRNNDAESIQNFREALRWADEALYPITRCNLLSQLGVAYMQINQYQQCIECQREVVKLASALGSEKIKGWAYAFLAKAYGQLKEYDQAMELFDEVERCSMAGSQDDRLSRLRDRAELLLAAERFDEAAAICHEIIREDDHTLRRKRISDAVRILGEIDEKCSRFEEAETHYRKAIEMGNDAQMPLLLARMGLARALYALKRYDEAIAILDACDTSSERDYFRRAQVLRLCAVIAEAQGDLRAVIDYERQAVAIEQEQLERQGEQALRNARIMAQIDLLEREAELERERRRRLERELANAVVALSDRKRQATAVEEHLSKVLTSSTSNSERAVTTALREALVSLRTGKGSQETVHHYLSKVDEDFQQRLRQRFPNLTRKQERLCGLIRAGLDSKEIASLLGLEPEGLKALRKRLRKALGINQEETLEKFLAEI